MGVFPGVFYVENYISNVAKDIPPAVQVNKGRREIRPFLLLSEHLVLDFLDNFKQCALARFKRFLSVITRRRELAFVVRVIRVDRL